MLTTACASLGSLALTWLSLHLTGHAHMGNAFWISLAVPVPLAFVFGGANFFLIAALERAWSNVHELAMADSLTGLRNRHHFIPAARREIELARRHHQPLALLLVDVDHFKTVNDAHGHLVGDRVLVEIAHRCRNVLRATDLLARWGGEEFIVLLPNTPGAQARQLAERMRVAVSATAQVTGRDPAIRVTVSVGVAGATPGQQVSLDTLIQLADDALYRAKYAGRDRVSMTGQDNIHSSTESPAAEKLFAD